MADWEDFNRLGRSPVARGGARANSNLCAPIGGHSLPRDGPRRCGHVGSGSGGTEHGSVAVDTLRWLAGQARVQEGTT